MTVQPALDETADGSERLSYNDSGAYMDTVVAIEIVAADADAEAARVRRALGWFAEVEARCSRFDPESELVALCRRPGQSVAVSPLLFNVLDVALAVARASNGAFDPTAGAALHAAGFDQNYKGGESPRPGQPMSATFRDVTLDRATHSVTLRRPAWLDLGGVAKGFAIDLAAAELAECPHFSINAGGDLFLRGLNVEGRPWRVGIRDPMQPECVLGVIGVTGAAVCTSGGYERPQAAGDGHHLLDPTSGRSPSEVLSMTTIGETAALADALSTAAFVLGPRRGLALLRRSAVEGLFVNASGQLTKTSGFPEFER